ncbi:MAG: amino acid adenylation domain-containing protein, partial [Cyclobacteriaceae bacterium]
INSQFSVALALKDIFSGPTIFEIVTKIENTGHSEHVPLEKKPREGRIPLSFAQERLWFIHELGQGDQYHIPGISLISGKLDMTAFENAINKIVERHENLRTCFRKEDDKPYQHIYDELKITFEKQTFPGAKADDPVVGEQIKEFTTRPFDMENGPLIRALLITLADDKHVLGLCTHHIISDGWSMGNLTNELSTLYEAYRKGEQAALPELEIQYADYAIWQKETYTPEVLDAELDHLANHLKGYEDLAMPTDFNRPRELSGKGNTIAGMLDHEVAKSLKQYCVSNGATVFSGLMAGVCAIVNIYSRQQDICIGTPVANRNQREIEPLIGFFVNTVINRVVLSDEETFASLQLKTKEEIFRSQQHQDIPFEKVVERVQPARDLSRTPLFQLMINFLKVQSVGVGMGEATSERLKSDYKSSKFDLNFTFQESPTGAIGFSLEYSEDLYTETTIRRLLDDMRTMFSQFVADPNRLISSVSLDKEATIVANESQQINKGSAFKPVTQTLQSKLEEVTALVSDRIAVRDEATEISYAELKEQSDRMALYLHQSGITNDSLVAVSIQRSVDMVVAIVAILKAGGAYFSIDPAYPAERKNSILADSNAKVLIAAADTAKDLTENFKGTILLLDSEVDKDKIKNVSGVLVSPMNPSGLSYVIYTSGSTGKPKGVLQTHRTIVNLVNYQNRTYGHSLDQPKQVSQFASASFDVSVQETFFTLLSGYTLNIVPEDVKYSTEKMLGFIKDKDIRIAYLPTAYLEYFSREFIQTEQAEPFRNLERIIVAGEALKINELIRDFFQKHPHTRLENQYGPSETHVVTAYTLPEDPASWTERPSIGKPVDNIAAYLLNEKMNAVPVGAVGELYFGGEGIARAYLNNESLTREKFLDNPFDEGMMYRTGDLARWGADGNIQFLGRADSQVKVRGFRIELGEIETALISGDNVTSAAVITKEIDGSTHLIAFVSLADSGKEGTEQALKSHLQKTLPDYMIPTAIQQIDQIPFNINGKVDRKLLAKQEVNFSAGADYKAPVGEVEQNLTEIWKDLLKLEKVGVSDNFFEIGGHSLLATQVMSRINRKFSVSIELKELFNSPTISQLAQLISREEVVTDHVELKQYERPEHIPLSYAQERLWYINELGQGYQYHMPTIIPLRGEFDKDAFIRSMNKMIERHENLRTTFNESDGKAYQVIHDQLEIPLIHRDLRERDNSADFASHLIKEFVNTPFDLNEGPLLRVLVIELEDDRFIIGLCMHHIISDGWSLDVLKDELSIFYRASLQNKLAELPPLPIQYADYALWQKERYGDGKLEKALNYWKEHLEGYEDLAMPTDYPRPRQISGKGKHITTSFSTEVSSKLEAYCKEEGITKFSALLTGVYALLNAYTRQEDICIGMPVANRTDEKLEGLIGFFVNTLINRVQIDADGSLSKLGHSVNAELINSQNYQDVPFEKIVEVVKPKRDMSRTPIFQAMASYISTGTKAQQNAEEPKEDGFDMGYDISKFELNFVFTDRGGKIYTSLEYNTDLFKAETASKLMDALELYLEALVNAPDTKLSEVDLLSDAEKVTVLETFNEGTSYTPSEMCLHEMFSEQAAIDPDKIALHFHDQTMTYGELDEKTHRLALYLQALGAGKGSMVALCLEQSMNMMVSILGILKAGATYVPIDPYYPEERIRYIMNDSQADILVTISAFKAGLRNVTSEDVLNVTLDYDQVLIDACDGYLTTEVTVNDLAYVIYTSGSTGKPKGTLITHKNVQRICKYPNYLNITPADRFINISNYAFDGSILAIFGAMTNGAELVLATKEMMMDINALSRCLVEKEVSFIFMTTALFNSLVDQSIESLRSLKKILFGGEQVSVNHVNAAIKTLGTDKMLHVYGPTETTVFATYYEIKEQEYLSTVPIGKPVTGTGCYILNKSLKPVPTGLTGELYISGDGLAAGYLRREDLTRERFIDSPFHENEKLYKTGDLVRWDESGNIVFEGRADQQVKVRGFRIELGEIETVLAAFDKVKRCAVIARNFKGTKQLVAFYTSGEEFEVEQLRGYLKNHLPDYMIPSAFERIEEIPLTPNGKTNTKALEELDIKMESSQKYVAPETETQKKLAIIWQDVLEVEKVGLMDNFFELGGHSLLATQI